MIQPRPSSKQRWNPGELVARVDWMIILWVVAAFLLAYIVLLPIGYTLIESFTDKTGGFTLGNLSYLITPSVLEAIVNTLMLVIGVGIISVLIGVPLAFGVSRTNMWGKGLVKTSIIVSLISPPFLVSMAYIVLAGPNAGYANLFLRNLFHLTGNAGPLNVFSLWGLIVLCIPGSVGLVFLQTFPALQNMDPSLEEASRMAGASPFKTAMKVTLPLARPSIFAGAFLAGSVVLAAYGAPHMLGINVLTIAIRQAFLVLDFKAIASLSVLVIVLSMTGLRLYRASIKASGRYQTVTPKGFRPNVMHLGKGRHLFTILGVVYALFAFVVPYSTLIIVSLLRRLGGGAIWGNFTLDNYAALVSLRGPRDAIFNSLRLAFGTATLVVTFGVLIGYIVVRTKIRGRGILDYIANLPQGIAGTALAAGLIVVYLNPPFISLGLYGTQWMLLLAYVTRFIPVGMRICQSSLIQVSGELEESSRIHGASRFRTLQHITIPLVKGGLLYAWILVFIQTLPELSASVLLRNAGTDVLSTTIMSIWDGPGGLRQASALGVVLFIIIAVLLVIVQSITGRSYLDATQRQGKTR